MDRFEILASASEDDRSIPSLFFDIFDTNLDTQQILNNGCTSGVVTDSTSPSGQIQHYAIGPASSVSPWIDGLHPALATSLQSMPGHHQNFGECRINPQLCNPRNEDIEDDSNSPPKVKE